MKSVHSRRIVWAFRACLRWLSSSGSGCVADAFVPRLVVHSVWSSCIATESVGGLTASSSRVSPHVAGADAAV